MPTPPTRTVLLTLDGVVHDSDLPVQAFARHITDGMAPDQIQSIIGGMRGFLEDKPDLIPAGIDLTPAADGYGAVEILARAAGLTSEQIEAARLASRVDLAASAWAVDDADGLAELLAAFDGRASVSVLAARGDPAVDAVLDSIEADLDAVDHLAPDTDPSSVLVIGSTWPGPLAEAHQAGSSTVLIDRFQRGRGTPTYRADDLRGVLQHVQFWLDSSPQEGQPQEGRNHA